MRVEHYGLSHYFSLLLLIILIPAVASWAREMDSMLFTAWLVLGVGLFGTMLIRGVHRARDAGLERRRDAED